MASVPSGAQLLSPQMRRALTSLSNKIFTPKASNYDNLPTGLPGNEVVTNLPLQMTLYFNAFFFPFWFSTYCVMLEVKYTYLADTYKVILIAILVLLTAIEVARLYLGFVGNLQEKVPELAGFLLLTLMLQTPSMIFLLAAPGALLLPMEGATHSILFLMILVEIIAGFSTASAMTKQQATKFHLQQFIDLENMNTPLIEHPLFDEVGRYDR